jgi:adenosylcobyric acid synthase
MRLARCVMVQGTASDVGKSVIATALCRVLADEGFRVAPFKGQNMSLNAAVTPDGREIGRAQAAQADAARVPARVEMNPILLKPEGDTRSQVVVLGRSTGTRSAREYWRDRAALWPTVRGALRTLRSEYDVIVIEGAGSPAEMNLRRTDLANMRVAAAAQAAVLLVGDIERGGIFAQLLGTLALLPATDRRRVRGLIVNKFRGDPALFADGARYLRRAARLPVLGVLPHDRHLAVPAEDSVALDRSAGPEAGAVDIAVIRYPRISNFDDFGPLSAAGASVRYVRDPAALGTPDLVVLPGSKTTIADLEWLRDNGIGARLRSLADAGVPIVGICGGFQMLGATLRDPDAVEGPARTVRGLGLLPVSTTFRAAKRTVLVRGCLANGGMLVGATGLRLRGYELHAGDTRASGAVPFATLVRPDGRRVADGAVSADGRIVGTYLHGLFDNELFRAALLLTLARRRGVSPPSGATAVDRYAHLATWFRAAVDVPQVLAMIEVEHHA